MSKAGGFMTPKAIGNRIKAKGLQKIRWFCQMCEKQCRDENGFKCHQTGEAHLRQMALFREDPTKFMDNYSREFEAFFMAVMKRKGGLRVKANTVYQEVVADRLHVHMTSTCWETLGSFVQYLGKNGLCRVDQTEQGWFVQYIDRDPRFVARQEEIAKRAEASMDSEERAAEQLRKQVALATKAEREAKGQLGEDATVDATPTELKERAEEEKIVFSMGSASAAASSSSSTTAAASSSAAASSPSPASSAPFVKPATPFAMAIKPAGAFNAFAAAAAASAASDATATKRKGAPSALDALMVENERLKANDLAQAAKKAKLEPAAAPIAAPAPASSSRLDYWLHPNIIVRLLNKKLLGGALYKQKGVVLRVVDKYIGELRVQSSDPSIDGTVLKIDQDELETVLPAIGKVVQVVNGKYRGEVAVLMELHEAKYQASIRIESGVLRGREVDGIEYEDICKLNEA